MILKVGKETWVSDSIEYEPIPGSGWRCTLKSREFIPTVATPATDTTPAVRSRSVYTESQGVGTGASPTEAFDQAVQDVLDKINGLREQRLATR